jgi:predicted ATPase
LLSSTTKDHLPPEIELRDLGQHRLRDLNEPEHIFQAVSPHFPLNVRPIRSLTPRPTNLPAQLASLVGREQNVAEVCHLLRQPEIRLLSLLGPGGIGKTRLSIQVGASLLDEYEDGVFFIPLAPLNDGDAVVNLIAHALKVQEDTAAPLLETVKAAVQSRQILFIFDNFEHILDSAPLLNDLLAAAARIKILVTSRESLFIYGERTYTVPPLKLPDVDDDIPQLRRSPAVALFLERIQALQPEFVFSEATAPDVVTICRTLEGLPLALELAAARIRDLTLENIAQQIARRLTMLSKGPRDLPTRQQTMRGAIEWSYHLLSDAEQRAFARLAIFEGQFFARAAYTIAAVPDLTTFKNKSLLQQTSDDTFSMLAVLREYALERLADFDQLTAIRAKHAAYYCQWLEAAEPHLNGRDQIKWFNDLDIEQFNVQAALEWYLQQQDIENAGRMVAVLWRYWATQSLMSEGERWINQVLIHADKLSPLLHARVTQGAGRLALLRHNYARATSLQQISLALYKSVNHQAGQAAVLLSLGETEYEQGNHIQAENYFGESLGLFREVNDNAGIGRCLSNLGSIIIEHGEFAKAEPVLRESLALAREHGSSEAVALSLYDLAGSLCAQGKFVEAEGCYRESLALYQELNFTIGIAVMLTNLGFTFQGMGNHALALDNFLQALRLLQNMDEVSHIAECLIGLAGTFLDVDKRELSTRLLSAATAILTPLNDEMRLDYAVQAQYDRVYAAVHGDDALSQSAWAAGQSTSLEQIIKDIFKDAQPKTTA